MVEYKPIEMSMLLISVLERAVLELLEQHHCYSKIHLVEFLSKYYPEVQAAIRGPIAVVATLGAKHAVLMHAVAERNACSENTEKRFLGVGNAFSFFGQRRQPRRVRSRFQPRASLHAADRSNPRYSSSTKTLVAWNRATRKL